MRIDDLVDTAKTIERQHIITLRRLTRAEKAVRAGYHQEATLEDSGAPTHLSDGF